MPDILRRHKYALNRILIPAARILSPEFNAVYVFLTGSHVEILRNLLAYATRETTFVDEYHGEYYLTPDDDDWNNIQAIVADLEEMLMTITLGFYDAYVCVKDVKNQGTHGGSFTSGAWRTRDVNLEHADASGICSINSNQVTLAGGTYRVLIRVTARMVERVAARLYSITDTLELLASIPDYITFADKNSCVNVIVGRIVLDDTTILEVQHRSSGSHGDTGFGYAANFSQETYLTAEFWREA